MRRASSRPDTTCTSSPASSCRRATNAPWLRASRVAEVATATISARAVAAGEAGERAADGHAALDRRRAQQVVAELLLAQAHDLALQVDHLVGAPRRDAHDHEPHRVGADVDEADDAAVAGRRLRLDRRRGAAAPSPAPPRRRRRPAPPPPLLQCRLAVPSFSRPMPRPARRRQRFAARRRVGCARAVRGGVDYGHRRHADDSQLRRRTAATQGKDADVTPDKPDELGDVEPKRARSSTTRPT